jgi:putative ABC transport system permease protein
MAGGTLGLLLAYWLTGSLVAIFPNNIANLSIPVVTSIPIDGNVVAFTLVATLVAAGLFGLVPALEATRPSRGPSLQEGARGAAAGAAGPRLRWLLIVAETATAMVLLAGAALLVASFTRLQRSDMGMKPDGVMSAQVLLPPTRYPDVESVRAFADKVLERLQRLPGAEAAGVTNYLPLSGFWGTASFILEGAPPPRPGEEPEADNRVASPRYFESLGIALVRGRGFTPRDGPDAPPVAIVNEAAARRFWRGEDPVGRRIRMGTADAPLLVEIVGVVRDVKSFGLDQETHPELFRPLAQRPSPLLAFTVRTRLDPESLAGGIRRAVWDVDPQQPLLKVLPMSRLAAESLALRRVTMLLLAAFAALATVLAGVGIYGVIACMVAQRTSEIGVRLALGARPGDVVRMLIVQGLRPVAAGLGVGLLAALALVRLVAGLLYGTSPADPATYAGAVLMILAVAAAACYLPARRAVTVDPMLSLRQE